MLMHVRGASFLVNTLYIAPTRTVTVEEYDNENTAISFDNARHTQVRAVRYLHSSA